MHKKKQESKQEQPLQNMTLEQAEKIILEQLKAKKNMRDIVKMKFPINGVETGFNIDQIRQIKEKYIPKINLDHRDSDKAYCFKLFKKGLSPTEVVIKTNLSPEFVQKAYQEFLEFEEKEVFPKNEVRDLYEFLKNDGWSCSSLLDIKNILVELIPCYEKYMQLLFHCEKCGTVFYPEGKLLDDARNYLAQNYGHSECGKK